MVDISRRRKHLYMTFKNEMKTVDFITVAKLLFESLKIDSLLQVKAIVTVWIINLCNPEAQS
jgi:hypothetical protein